jgi:hypothetical protein
VAGVDGRALTAVHRDGVAVIEVVAIGELARKTLVTAVVHAGVERSIREVDGGDRPSFAGDDLATVPRVRG